MVRSPAWTSAFRSLSVWPERLDRHSRKNKKPDKAYKWPTRDPDDCGAAASFAIVAKLGLLDKLVHVSYNNFIDAPSGPDAQNQLKIRCEGAAERWGFRKTKIFDVTSQLREARKDLATEMGKSTASDPLWFMHAGLSEFLYQVVEEVIKQGKLEALHYVYLVSHCKFNEDEQRRDYHRIWKDVQDRCGKRIQYKKIRD